jgi:hypothetical protein
MTIPGIHARHRGEVMALGSAPPPAKVEDAAEGKGGAIAEGERGTGAGKAIHNVYRLFRDGSAHLEEDGHEGLGR